MSQTRKSTVSKKEFLKMSSKPLPNVTKDEKELFDLCWTAENMIRIEELLSNSNIDLDINKRHFMGDTCLIRAARRGHIKLVRLLLEHGADKNIKSKFPKQTVTEAAILPEIRELIFSKASSPRTG